MKRRIFYIVFLLGTGLLFGETRYITGLQSLNPQLWAEGYSVTATAIGGDALLTNPAGLSRGKKDLDLDALINTTAYFPLGDLASLIQKIGNNEFGSIDYNNTPLIDYITDLVTTTGAGMYLGAQTTMVYNGVGIGFYLEGSTYAKGATLIGTLADVDFQLGTVIGFSYPVEMEGLKINLGGDLKILQRYHGKTAFIDLLSNPLGMWDSTLFLNGMGIGVDLGAIVDWNAFSFGLSFRDIGTFYNFRQNTMSEIIAGAGFPSSGTSKTDGTYVKDTNTYVVPRTANIGAAYHPDMGSLKDVVDPRVSVDFQIPLMDEFTQPSFWTTVHIGASAKLINFLDMRAGLNQGYFTFGFGTNIAGWKTDCAVYSQELGRIVGESRRAIISIQTGYSF